MELQTLYGRVRKAVQTYNMINDGDKIAVGISGGKDSLGLLYALAGLRRFYPVRFSLEAITVNLGFEGFCTDDIAALCKKLEVDYHVIDTDIGRISAEEGCGLCARLRKGALLDKALELGCNSIAYAHNMDDVVETMMLSLIYEGRFSTFYPVTIFEENVKVIRPYVFVTNSESIGVKNRYNLPVANNPCPFDKTGKRSYVRELLKDINKNAPGVKKRMMTAIMDGTLSEWSK